MKRVQLFTLIAAFLLLNPFNSQSQTLAVTELGDTIYVYDNGTWSFEMLDVMPETAGLSFLDEEVIFDTIRTPFTYSSSAKKSIENKNKQFKIRYDEKVWERLPPAQLNGEAEFALKAKSTDIWCIIISEETEIEAGALFRIAKNTMKENLGGDAAILKSEVRTVNGTEVVRGVLNAKHSGISFIFDTYYYSDDKGSVQFTVYTSDKVWEKNTKMIEELLNGFVVE